MTPAGSPSAWIAPSLATMRSRMIVSGPPPNGRPPWSNRLVPRRVWPMRWLPPLTCTCWRQGHYAKWDPVQRLRLLGTSNAAAHP